MFQFPSGFPKKAVKRFRGFCTDNRRRSAGLPDAKKPGGEAGLFRER
jgi:hypothetical protein